MNYYEHHLGDYDGATAHLSWSEDCAYRRLICTYYRNEGPIPDDIKQACRLVRATSKSERDAVQQVLTEFFDLEADGWHHKRCDEELWRYKEKSAKARASVSKRWANRDANEMPTQSERITNVDANVLPTQYEGNTPRARPQSPVTSNQTPEREAAQSAKRGSRLPPDWELPEDWGDWARRERPDLLPLATADRFADYWHGKAGKDGIKLDWQATWRNWVRGERAPPGTANGQQFGRADPHSTVADNPNIAATQDYLRRQAEAAAKATPPPASVLALRSRRSGAL